MSIARDIAEYVHSIDYDEVSDRTTHSAKRSIVDAFGCAISGAKSQPAAIALKTFGSSAWSGPASVLGTGKRFDPQIAAFINGTMERFLDYNDTYDGKEFAHPSDNIFPLLAVAEAEKKKGSDALTAILLAYEIQCRLADSAALWKSGWDHVIYGLVSVSAAASRLMGLSADKTEQAINIALGSHLTMRQVRVGEISMWKAAVFANAARNAIFSAMLARNGMTGPSPIFEGANGFVSLVAGKMDLDVRKFATAKNDRFKINETLTKYWPAETRAQAAIWCAISLKGKIGSLDKIREIEVGTNEGGLRIIGSGAEKWNPKTKETADHSLPYIVAVALMDGNVNINSFKRSRFTDRQTLQFMKKIKVVERKKYTNLFEKGGTVNANDITIITNDGKSFREEVIYPKGHPKNPMNDSELDSKFMSLAQAHLGRQKSRLALDALWNFQHLSRLGSLFSIIKFK